MKKRKKWLLGLLACVGVVCFLYLGLQGSPDKQIVMDYARNELEWMDHTGEQGPGIYSTFSMSSSRPFIELGYQEIPEELSYVGTITSSLYGFPAEGQIKAVTLHTYVDGALLDVKTASRLPNLSREIVVVEAAFRVDVPPGGDLTCVLQAVTEDGLCYRHTVLEEEGYELRSNTKTEVYTEDGAYLKTLYDTP